TTTMKSVGEAMAIGRSFPEALQKAMRSLEKKGVGLTWAGQPGDKDELLRRSAQPTEHRLRQVQQAFRAGATVEELHDATKIDPWFLDQMLRLEEMARVLATAPKLDADLLRDAKGLGFSDVQIGEITGRSEDVVRELRHALGIHPV